MSWNIAFKAVEPYIVKIETPAGSGTGFFFAYNEPKVLVGIATALHVVQEADEWRQPIKIIQAKSGKELFLAYSDRAVLVDYKRDTAVILVLTEAVKNGGLALPEVMLSLFPSDRFKMVGTGLAWAGYPAIAAQTLCLFQGGVSAFNKENDSYYIDGIAINGVSGGPVFEEQGLKDENGVAGDPRIVGIVSAYHYNRQGGGNLPGLLMAHDATHLTKTVEHMRSLDEARKKAKEEADKQQAQTQPPAGPGEPQRPRQESAAPQPGPAEPSVDEPAQGAGPVEPRQRRRRKPSKKADR